MEAQFAGRQEVPAQKSPHGVIAGTVCPVEVQAPFTIDLEVLCTHRCNGNAHLAGPSLIRSVYACGVFEVGIPGGGVERRFVEIDLQIDPLVVGRDLEFIVVVEALGLRIEEDFHDVPIPQLPTFLGCIFTYVNIQCGVLAPIGEVYVAF